MGEKEAVFGNLAYGTSSRTTAVPKKERYPLPQLPDYELPERPEVVERPVERVRAERKAKAEAKQGISILALLGSFIIAMLFLLVIMSQANLTQISGDSGELQKELERLNEEESKLLLKYESAFNLDEVEAYAIQELGMIKAEPSQVHYIKSRGEDQAVILNNESNDDGILGMISSFLSRLASYLG